MKLTTQPTEVTIIFSPEKYWLRRTAGHESFDQFTADTYGEYCLSQRIDMSYAGKDDQEGAIVLFLTTEQAEVFRKAGFDELV